MKEVFFIFFLTKLIKTALTKKEKLNNNEYYSYNLQAYYPNLNHSETQILEGFLKNQNSKKNEQYLEIISNTTPSNLSTDYEYDEESERFLSDSTSSNNAEKRETSLNLNAKKEFDNNRQIKNTILLPLTKKNLEIHNVFMKIKKKNCNNNNFS